MPLRGPCGLLQNQENDRDATSEKEHLLNLPGTLPQFLADDCSLGVAGMRQLDAEYRLDKNIKIAMLYLEDDDAVSAEAFIKKASALIGSCKARGRTSHRFTRAEA